MDILTLTILLFLLLESLNIATLYVAPGSTRGNGVGVFRTEGELRPAGYARTLGRMIAAILGLFALALIWSLVR